MKPTGYFVYLSERVNNVCWCGDLCYVLCKLAELVDGFRHVASIAQMANGDVDVIKSRVANLVLVSIAFLY